MWCWRWWWRSWKRGEHGGEWSVGGRGGLGGGEDLGSAGKHGGEWSVEEGEDLAGVVLEVVVEKEILEEGESMAEKRVLEKAEDVVGVVGEVEKALMVTVMEGDSEGGKGAKGRGGNESGEKMVVEGEEERLVLEQKSWGTEEVLQAMIKNE